LIIFVFKVKQKQIYSKKNKKSPAVKMSALLNLVDQNADTLQQMALLAYVKDPELGEPFLEAITTYKVGKSVWKVVSQEDKIEQARNDCILNVAAYVKANPRARPMEIQKKVQDEIEIFKAKIQ
jgi:hypothetical protein